MEVALHNNFGICDQVTVNATQEGISRVKAFLDGPNRVVESDKAEVATYVPLQTLKPSYSAFVQDLYSSSQSG